MTSEAKTIRVEIGLSITLWSPFILQGLGAAALGIDAAALRDDRQNGKGRPIIPADQVKGLLRAACETLAAATGGAVIDRDGIDYLFGCRSSPATDQPGESDIPRRAAVIFGDLTADGGVKPTSFTRVSIDPVTGAAKTGFLQTVELVAPLHEIMNFTGGAIARIDPERLPSRDIVAVLNKAIALIPAVGGLKSAGFGRVKEAKATLKAQTPLALPQPPTGRPSADAKPELESVSYQITFDRRILVDGERLAPNVWRGRAIIPGTVFKGALAERLKLGGHAPETDDVVGRALAAIRFTHAFPANAVENGRPSGFTPPLSLYVHGTGQEARVACGLCRDTPGRVPSCAPAIPRFAWDWKDEERIQVLGAIKWPDWKEPVPLPRGHTEIGKDYIARDEQLFVDAARSVLLDDRPRPWCLEVHRGEADPAVFAWILDLLDRGLDGIGATGARASFTRHSRPWDWPSFVDPERTGADTWAVTLATPALMLHDPTLQTDLFEQYAAYWKTHEQAELVNFYAAQRLTGGYLGKRRRLYGADRYYPFVLTEPGSVFLLRGLSADTLKRLSRTGLPPQAPEGASQPLTWRTCPYLPANGYGAILVNAIDHVALAGGNDR